MMKEILAATALLVLTGCSVRLSEDELRLTRERLDKYLFNEENLTQSEMTRRSADELELAEMERYIIEYRIRNQTGYEKIKKQFMADCELFEKKLKAEWEKPSDYAGGSLEPMDRNDRMTDLVRKRMDELKTKWLAKP